MNTLTPLCFYIHRHMKVKVHYSALALHAAAEYIWNNNPSVKTWPNNPQSIFDIIKDIKKLIKKYLKHNIKSLKEEMLTGRCTLEDWVSHVSSGGYTLLFILDDASDDEINITVEITVNPAINAPAEACGYMIEDFDKFMMSM